MSECWERNNWLDPSAEAIEKLTRPTEKAKEVFRLLGIQVNNAGEQVKPWKPEPLPMCKCSKEIPEMNNVFKDPKAIFYMHGKKLFTERAIVPPEMGAVYVADPGNCSGVPAGTKLKVIGVNKFKATSVNSALYIVQLSALN